MIIIYNYPVFHNPFYLKKVYVYIIKNAKISILLNCRRTGRMGKIKEKSKRAVRVAAHKGKRATIKTALTAKKAAALPTKGAKMVANTKTYQKAKTSYKKAHHNVAETPHKRLMEQSPRYAAWHSWQYKKVHHGHIHGAVVLAWVLFVVSLIGAVVPSVSALNVWEQNDWSGGQGTNTGSQYSTSSSIDTSTEGQLSLAKSDNYFSNGGFDSNTDSWNGYGFSHETTTKYEGSGSAKIQAGVQSSSNFYAHTTYDGASTRQRRMASGDLNGDGRDDVAIANIDNYTISIHWGGASGQLSTPTTVATHTSGNPYDVSIGDINRDGHLDMVLTYTAGVNLSVFINDGEGGFERSDFTGISGQCAHTLGNFNNDDYLDIAALCVHSSSYLVYTNTGSSTYYGNSPQQFGIGASAGSDRNIAAVDINGDGYDDLSVGVNGRSDCKLYYSLSNGGGFEAGTTVDINDCGPTNSQGYMVAGGDFNKDGYEDIAVGRRTGTGGTSASSRNMLTIYLGASDGVLTSQADYGAVGNMSVMGSMMVSDYDLDGHLDVSVANSSSNISVFYGVGDGTFGNRTEFPMTSSAFYAVTGDMNGDGKYDIATSINSSTTTVNSVGLFINKIGGDAVSQKVTLGSAGTYYLSAYVYTTGDEVTAEDVDLYLDGKNVPTQYSSTNISGWYSLSAEIEINEPTEKIAGVIAKQGKTIYVDNVALYKFADAGTLVSAVHDLGFGGDWGTLTYTTSHPQLTTVKVRTSDSPTMDGAPEFSGCPSLVSGTDLTDQNCVTNNHRYVQYQVSLVADGETRPTLTEISIAYAPWDTTPPVANASDIIMKKEAGGATINSNGWTNGPAPYFEWTEGADGEGESGIKGYCLYLGQDSTANPVTAKGLLGASPLNTDGVCQFAVSTTNIDLSVDGLISTALTTSDDPYYLSIRTFDNAGNVYEENAQFQFKFDNTPPTNPAFISSPSQFVADKTVTLTWPNSGDGAPTDAHSGVAGLQYRIGSNSSWYGDGENGDGLLENDGSYTTRDALDFDNITEGNNVVYMRTWDQAGNITTQYVTTVIKLNTASPGSPQNVTVTPTTNTTNSFAFSWMPPSSFQGSASNLTYCYTVNTTPTVNTCTFTTAGQTSLPEGAYATQPGENTFYVVAKDEAGNINYATAASTTFTANTSAPGMPLDLDIADVSIKASASWRLALSWNVPASTGAGIASYRILRSTDNNNFSQVASTAGTSYVDSGLGQSKYFYKIRACDSANNCGAFSSTVSLTPTGKFTSSATLTAQPSVSGVSTKKATIKWATNRESDSRISLGTKPGEYAPFQVASAEQVTDHNVELNNLTPGTTYYAKASWTDVDGNTGSSSEFIFKTEPAPSTQEVQTSRVTLSTAQITFTSVSAAKVVIQYGKSDSFGGVKEIQTSLAKSTYAVEINGLDDGSKYLYRLNTFDAEGNEYTGSTVLSFTTPARPRIENLRFQPIDGEPTSTQKITWTTNVPASSLVRFTPEGGPSREVSSSQLVSEHEVIVRDLHDDTNYTLVAESRDKDGNLAVSDAQNLRTALDTRPPKISDITVETTIRGAGAEARGQIIISWKTDEPATSQVGYAEGSEVTTFNNRSSEDTGLATEHVVIVSDLPTSRVYSIQPISRDRSGNSGVGEIETAIIGRASDSIITIVLNTLRKVFGF